MQVESALGLALISLSLSLPLHLPLWLTLSHAHNRLLARALSPYFSLLPLNLLQVAIPGLALSTNEARAGIHEGFSRARALSLLSLSPSLSLALPLSRSPSLSH